MLWFNFQKISMSNSKPGSTVTCMVFNWTVGGLEIGLPPFKRGLPQQRKPVYNPLMLNRLEALPV